MTNKAVAASSATYRKVVNGIAKALDKDPIHSPYPSEDFESALDGIPDALKQKAMEWYVRGIKRGMSKATDLMVENKIYIKDGVVYAPKEIQLNVRTRHKGEEWVSREIIVYSKEIGFE